MTFIDIEGLAKAQEHAVREGKMPPGDFWLTPRGAKRVVVVLEGETDTSRETPERGDPPDVQLCFEVAHLSRLKAGDWFTIWSPLRTFLDTFCLITLNPQDTIPKAEFAERFSAFCLGLGILVYTPVRLGREMRRLGVENGQRGNPRRRHWLGITWRKR